MWVFEGASANDFYREMIETIREHGEPVSPRGLPTQELLHVVTRINHPQCRVLTQPGRKLNPFFNMAETVWILAGRADAKWICFYNSQLKKYLDPPGEYFHGAYGERLRRWGTSFRLSLATSPYRSFEGGVRWVDQLRCCFHVLTAHHESRQAVMVLWNPWLDYNSVGSIDLPCNLAVTFKIRGGRLWMSVFNRSNDVVLGLTSTNIVQFSTLQEVLASWLEVDVGPYTHYSDSLHLYAQQVEGTQWKGGFNVYRHVAPQAMAPVPPDIFDGKIIKTLISTDFSFNQDKHLYGEAWIPQCCYWDSVAWALYAYNLYKKGDWPAALEAVRCMSARDWKIECLRFLADRLVSKYERARQQIINILREMEERDQFTRGGESYDAVVSYVMQSFP